MKRTASKERMRGKKPTTYRRVVTGNVKGKSVVQSDEPLLAYKFKTVPGYEHTLRILVKSKGLTTIPAPLFPDPAVPACTS
jgi:hypothetical protein